MGKTSLLPNILISSIYIIQLKLHTTYNYSMYDRIVIIVVNIENHVTQTIKTDLLLAQGS